MHILSNFITELDLIINIVKNVFKLDSAVFDNECKLVTSSADYIEHKGQTVHEPSIREAIYNKQVIVNHPGQMSSCLGCRFKDDCPSAIEILASITLGQKAIGVLIFTSFDPKIRELVAEEEGIYIKVIHDMTALISSMLSHKISYNETGLAQVYLNQYMSLESEGIICCDSNGEIHSINNQAISMLGLDSYCINSLSSFFPTEIVESILGEVMLSNYLVNIGASSVKISSYGVIVEQRFVGAIIKINKKKPSSSGSNSNDTRSSATFSLTGLKGSSAHMQEIKQRVNLISSSSSSVLITGKTGTGKGVLAKAIHFESSRHDKPFVMINCAAIPEALFESELFGYDSGAFTGAKKEGKLGKFELADEGTIFLDEIGELSPAMQAKLLTVLQEGFFERVGGLRPIYVDVRVIAATNADIEELISTKKFRSDLFYRLNIIPFDLHPLCERSEDIPQLINTFLSNLNQKLSKNILGFDNTSMKALSQYSWPGNIRQLQNTIEYCCNICTDSVITSSLLPKEILKSAPKELEQTMIMETFRDDPQRNKLLELLDTHGRSLAGKTIVAAEMGISLRSLYRRIGAFGIK